MSIFEMYGLLRAQKRTQKKVSLVTQENEQKTIWKDTHWAINKGHGQKIGGRRGDLKDSPFMENKKLIVLLYFSSLINICKVVQVYLGLLFWLFFMSHILNLVEYDVKEKRVQLEVQLSLLGSNATLDSLGFTKEWLGKIRLHGVSR